MSEEEKKAIEWFREDLAEEKEKCGKYNDYKKQVIKRNEKLLNLIEKQQKEIEHWKAGMKIVERDKNNHIERLEKELDNIKEIEKSHQEENGKLRVELEQEKEKNKEMTKQLNGAFDRGFISKNKIKEKYLAMEQEYARKVYDKNYNRTEVKKEEMYKRQVYEELLEEK